MGNQASTTINWSQLSERAQKCDISNAKDILTRLNIEFTENQDEEKKNDDNALDNNMEKYLNDYLDKLSDEDLKKLFLRFGVNPDFDDKATKKEKNDALKLIASKDFWRKNFALHPLQKRVKNWLFVHEKYRQSVAEIVEKSKSDLDASKALLAKYDKKLIGHSEFENIMLFKFMKENLDNSIIPKSSLDQLYGDHDEFPKLTETLNKCKDLKEYQTLIKEYQTKTIEHLEMEEQIIVHIWLNLNDEQYKKYRDYLSWKWSAVY